MYIIEKIIDEKRIENKIQYLVLWKGFDIEIQKRIRIWCFILGVGHCKKDFGHDVKLQPNSCRLGFGRVQ
jgi:hypothetical protein